MAPSDFIHPVEFGSSRKPGDEEFERWEEPEFIVEPLSGVMVAIRPRSDRPEHSPASVNPSRRKPLLWQKLLARWLALTGVGALLLLVWPSSTLAEQSLLNVSYDPTRELYTDYDSFFAERWKAQSGKAVSVRASHGGSEAQVRAVIDGLERLGLGAGHHAGGHESFPDGGDVDYVMRVAVAEMAECDAFYKRLIAIAPMKNVTSRFERLKHTTAYPFHPRAFRDRRAADPDNEE